MAVGSLRKDTHRLICEVKITDRQWQRNHFETLRFAYGRAPHFKWVEPLLTDVFIDREWESLYELDRYLTEKIAKDYLGIRTAFADSRDYSTSGVKHERMLNLVKSIGADIYLSGPAAKDYIVSEDYKEANIGLVWKDYSDYPVYPQIGCSDFIHEVSIIDLLCNVGEESPYYIWGWREESGHASWTE